MLGKLARWLVLLGFDAHFVKKSERSDLDIAEEALREGRILLTQDRRIPAVHGLKMLVLREQHFEDQLKRVLSDCGLKADARRLFSRCTDCGVLLARVSRESILEVLPPLVRTLETDFFRCPQCRHVYWRGTHVRNTIQKLEQMGVIAKEG